MKPTTAIALERLLEERVRKGEYAEGARLPTVRDMAAEMRVNKNTVVRAYQALERKGYLELVRGRGAFVRQCTPTSGAMDSRWLLRLDQLLADARQHELSRELVTHEIMQSLDRLYGRDGLRIAFVECNAPDIETLSGELSTAVGHPLDGLMLSDLLAQPADTERRFGLVVTTFYHLSEVTRALPLDARQRIVGVHAMPAHDALLQIARLHAQVIGLVCDLPGTVDNLVHIIHTYHPSATIMPALMDDRSRLKTLLKKADAIVVTRSCHERLMALQPKAPVIMVTFTIDQQSIDFLRARIEETKVPGAKS